MTDLERLVTTLNENGYTHILKMPDGSLCGIANMIYTTGLFCGLDATGWSRRYCYEKRQDAIDALDAWDGRGDPPGPWIKEKPGDRLGPGAVGDQRIPPAGAIMTRACTHCGRLECKQLGSPNCEEARKRMFEEMQRLIEQWANRRSAAERETR